jgi:hypothetical protein
MQMRITNRTGDVVTVRSFRSDDPVLWAAEATQWFHADQPGTIETGSYSKVKFAIYSGQVSAGDLGLGPQRHKFDLTGDFDNDRDLVLVRGQSNNVYDRDCGSKYGGEVHLGNYGAIDCLALKQSAAEQSAVVFRGLSKALLEIKAGIETIAKSLGELEKIAKLVTPVGLFSGPLFGMVQIILIALAPEKESPPPPTIDEITDAINNVVIEALYAQDARHVAQACVNAAQFCGHWAATARARVPTKDGQALPPLELDEAEKDRFLSDLHQWLHGDSNFQHRLGLGKATPAVAKYILPTFISGLLADLQMHRMDLMVQAHDGHAETIRNLTDLRDLAASAVTALGNAEAAFLAFRGDSIKKKYTLYNNDTANLVPELQPARDAFTLQYTGATDLGFLYSAVVQLGEYMKALDKDIASLRNGQPTTFVLPQKGRRGRGAAV